MKKNYDFSKAISNPYTKKLKTQITIRLDLDTVNYFKKLSEHFDMPYQHLINLYLRDCSIKKKKPILNWK